MNLRKFHLFTLLIAFALLSCGSDDDGNGGNATAIDIVTGVNAKSSSFSEVTRLGNPNVRMPVSISSLIVSAYPNPVVSALTIQLSQTDDVITDVWLVSANANKTFQDVNFNDVLSGDTYTVNEISQAATEVFSDLSTNNISLNLQDFETGYYRVFIKTENDLFWDNIYVDNDGADINEFFDYWE